MHPPAHCIGAPSCASALSIVAVRKNLFLWTLFFELLLPHSALVRLPTHTHSLPLPLFSVLDDSAACLLAPSPLSSFSPPQSPPPPRRRRRVPVPPSGYPVGTSLPFNRRSPPHHVPHSRAPSSPSPAASHIPYPSGSAALLSHSSLHLHSLLTCSKDTVLLGIFPPTSSYCAPLCCCCCCCGCCCHRCRC